MTVLVEIRDLEIRGDAGAIVEGISFDVAKGEVLALIGESGSGKTTIALALMGYARAGCRIVQGAVRFEGLDLAQAAPCEVQALRGARIAYIAQSAAAAFNPSRTLMDQVVEPALVHGLLSRTEAKIKAVELFRSLGLPDPDRIGARYPHQVSGGQLQRLMAAMALITDPALIILDEPTTALDVTTQIEALRVFKAVVRERGVTAVYVSHDLAVVAQMADRILVLQHGRMREIGAAERVLHAPADDYTRALMAAARPRPRPVAPADTPVPAAVLEVKGVSAGYGRGDGAIVVRDVDLSLGRGKSLGVIGESGSGKSTLARVIAGLVEPSAGEVRLNGDRLSAAYKGRTLDQLRRVQIVFQNADTALNPAHTVGQILSRPLELYGRTDRSRRVRELLELIRLPASYLERRVVELSGGQKQRVNLARALAAEPDVVLCDEVTSALDTVVAAAMLELLATLRRELSLSLIFISHDIGAVRAVCDDVAVLYAGRVVEQGPSGGFDRPPHHPYADLLIASAPEMRRGWLEETRAAAAAVGRGPRPADPRLCPFLTRCPVALGGVCDAEPPPRQVLRPHSVALCHRSGADLHALQTAAIPTTVAGR